MTASRRLVSSVLLIALAGGLATMFASPTGSMLAQEEPDGRISGRVIAGTAGATTEGVSVQLIILEDSDITGSEETAVVNGEFEFTVPARASRTYIPFVRHQGVQYFGYPVIIGPEEPQATRDITIFETTRETPDLRIVNTVVTVLALDRQSGQMALEREDLVETPGDRVFIGDDVSVTLRIPAPPGTLDAGGDDAGGSVSFEGGVVSTTTPMRPDELTTVVTRYIIQYDPADDRYLLRVTAPVATDHIEVRVPQRFIHRLEPREGAERSDDVVMDGEWEGDVLQTVVLDENTEPGRGLLVELIGLSGRQETLVLTERGGAAVAAVGALALIAGAAFAVFRRRGSTA